MYFSAQQIERSLKNLAELNPFFGTVFLALTEIGLPENETTSIGFSALIETFLQKYYKPASRYPEFYTPFKTSQKQKRWNTYQYVNTLQRLTADTFSDVLLHPRSSRDWGWKSGYTDILARVHLARPIPTFDLAVWLFRNRDWPADLTVDDVIETFFAEFQVQPAAQQLFQRRLPPDVSSLLREVVLLREQAVTANELFSIIGYPPGAAPQDRYKQSSLFGAVDYGARLQRLTLTEIGPATEFELDLAARLNVITGDNALGKTFLLECAWWTLTDTWASSYPAYPGPETRKSAISFQIGKEDQPGKVQMGLYDRKAQRWYTVKKRQFMPGLTIFAQADGSFAVWDPAKINTVTQDGAEAFLRISREQVWDGVKEPLYDRMEVLCRGLIEDWITWQTFAPELFDVLCKALTSLSPHPQHPLVPGRPVRLSERDVTPIPTLHFPYGDVPVTLCSAGIKRIVALAYILVWAWSEHADRARLQNGDPQRSIVLLIDEMEAHLHPFWQRAIVPAIINVIQALADDVSTQIIIATHSPLVLASMEPAFDELRDKLFHLYLDIDEGAVQLNEVPFVKQGRVDRWLTSDIFGLAQPRSREAEAAIQEANAIQLEDEPRPAEIQRISKNLLRLLAQDDDYWPLWVYFAKERGIVL